MQTINFLESRVEQALNTAEECIKNLNAVTEQKNNNLVEQAQENLNDAQLSLDEIKKASIIISAQDANQVNKRYSELRDRFDLITSYFQQAQNRNQLFQGSSNVDHSIDDHLNSSLQFTQEANQYGVQILDNLGRQREKLFNTNNNLDEITTSVDETGGIVRKMKSIQTRKKILTWFAVVLLILAIILLLYLTF